MYPCPLRRLQFFCATFRNILPIRSSLCELGLEIDVTQHDLDGRCQGQAGKPAEAIIETAKEQNADLIVVGSHGRAGVERFLMGSVAERVIVLSACPVLVVKTQ